MTLVQYEPIGLLSLIYKHLFMSSLLLCAGIASGSDGVVIWTGGVSLEERAAAPAEGTKLQFFGREGNYLSDVTVVVKDADGRELVNTMTLGPWLILDLPPGRYSVLATLQNGVAQGGIIDVDGSRQEFGYRFSSE